MEYDLHDVQDIEAHFEDELEAMIQLEGAGNPDQDVNHQYQVSDEMLLRAIEEEQELKNMEQNKENMEQNNANREQNKENGEQNKEPSESSSIEFSFMSSGRYASAITTPIRIENSFNKGVTKRRSEEEEGRGKRRSEDEEGRGKRTRRDSQGNKVYSRIPEGDFVRISSDSDRVFLKVKPFIQNVTSSSPTDLLSHPFHYLKSQVMRDYHQTRPTESHPPVGACPPHPTGISPDTHNLWVEDYTPAKYVELLSDDGTNRQVLHWLKLWDGIVYGRKMRDKAPQEKPKWQSEESWQRYQRFQEPDYDERGFPFKKTVLIGGAPGLGKTTLAHVAARHAGYSVVEMNASDDRSAAQFTEAIDRAVRMSSVLSPDNRPNCLVIDEIDGAGSAAIQVLVKVLSAAQDKKGDKRCRRPIICICNDPWGAALRDLRKIALLITMPQTQSARLATRLKSICAMESLVADMSSLLFLCDKTDNDIRASLNTLQFLKARKEPLSMVSLKGMEIGHKDKQQSLFKLWESIFTQPRAAPGSALLRTEENKHSQQRFSALLSLVGGTGELEKQVDGIHENLLLLKIRQGRFNILVQSLEWFLFYDILDREIRHTMSFQLYCYQMYTPILFSTLFAQVHKPKLVFPTKSRETRTKQQEVSETVEVVTRETQVKARLGLTKEHLAVELSSYICRLLCPQFRPVNIQLYSDKEKRSKDSLLALMRCYDLQFTQRRTAEGQVTYTLEPDLQSMARYSELGEVKQLPYSIKQLLSREVALRRIGGVGEGSGTTTTTTTAASVVPEKTKHPKIDFRQERVPVNYLSKVVSNKEAFLRKKEAYVQKLRTFYKFNEGYSNAVRKPVKISMFM